jgi:uncharacterized protein YhaN
VWVEDLHVHGFGRLRNIPRVFGEQVTVVTGLNESGKSTVHAALLACLFGFFDSIDLRTQRSAEARRQRYEPWRGGGYGLTAHLRGWTAIAGCASNGTLGGAPA